MDKLVVQMHSFRIPTNRSSNFLRIPPPTKVPRIALGTVIIPEKKQWYSQICIYIKELSLTHHSYFLKSTKCMNGNLNFCTWVSSMLWMCNKKGFCPETLSAF